MTNKLSDAAASTHTPGPWKITKCDDGVLMVHTDGDTVCFGDPNHKNPDDSANFRMIAAAPDMLAALKNIREVDAEELLDGCSEVWAEVNAAITKAEAVGDRTAEKTGA